MTRINEQIKTIEQTLQNSKLTYSQIVELLTKKYKLLLMTNKVQENIFINDLDKKTLIYDLANEDKISAIHNEIIRQIKTNDINLKNLDSSYLKRQLQLSLSLVKAIYYTEYPYIDLRRNNETQDLTLIKKELEDLISILKIQIEYLNSKIQLFTKNCNILKEVKNNELGKIKEFLKIEFDESVEAINYLEKTLTKGEKNKLYNYIKYDKIYYITLLISNKNRKEELQKLQIELNEINEKIQLEKNVVVASEIVKSFIDSYLKDPRRFCTQKNISLSLFKSYVELIKDAYPNLYEKYILKIKGETEEEINELESSVKRLGKELLDNPNYTLLDYYLNYNYNFLVIRKAATKVCTREEKIAINKFTSKNLYLLPTTDSSLLNVKIFFQINEQMIESTEEQRKYALKYLNDNNLPKIESIYKEVLKRIMTGVLTKEKTLVIK